MARTPNEDTGTKRFGLRCLTTATVLGNVPDRAADQCTLPCDIGRWQLLLRKLTSRCGQAFHAWPCDVGGDCCASERHV